MKHGYKPKKTFYAYNEMSDANNYFNSITEK